MDELFKEILMDVIKNGMKPVEKNKVQEMKEQAMQLMIAVFN